MSPRRLPSLRLVVALVAGSVCASPAVASASRGFKVPSRNTTCAVLSASQSDSGPGLYCSSSYITRNTYDGVGVARLGRSGRARNDGAGNDILLYISGYNGDDRARSKRPVLGYGTTFRAGGYRCTSRATGLTCRRGSHGFFLSRETQRFF